MEKKSLEWLEAVSGLWIIARAERMVSALQKYGRHLPSCERSLFTHEKYACTCGLDTEIDAAKRDRP